MKKIYKNDKYLRGLYRENKQWKISVWFAILGFSGWKYQNEIFYKVTLGIWLSSKESACNAGDASSIPGSGRYPNPWVRKIPWRRAWQLTHSSILAWRIPWTEEFGRLQSIGLQRVGHDRATEHVCTHKITLQMVLDLWWSNLWFFSLYDGVKMINTQQKLYVKSWMLIFSQVSNTPYDTLLWCWALAESWSSCSAMWSQSKQ